jgi:hypothetical protein
MICRHETLRWKKDDPELAKRLATRVENEIVGAD